ncbi:MAG: acetylglutamate kinase [Leptospiraceae bacterium]|nr:MAG: acetylglutamate kinase [Leptospiraceae bacterium]
MLYSETIKIILESLGKKDEVDYYLKRFKTENSDFFSIIVPDYETIELFWEAFLSPIEILYKIELIPLIYIGGPDYDTYKKKFLEYDFFEIYMIKDKRNFTIQRKKNKIPVIFCNSIFIKFFYEYSKILPKRIHFVRNTGFIRTYDNENLFQLEPEEDFKDNWKVLINNKNIIINPADIGIYLYCSHFYNLNPELHISITSSFLLLKELFTVKGAGTLIRKKTKIIHLKYEDIKENLKYDLKNKIERYFSKKLKPDALKEITDIIIDKDYQSFIILEKKSFGYYLSKFAISIEARGKGIAQDLWDYVESLKIPLFWKTRKDNSIRKWYEKISDGLIRYENYIIYWKNLSYKEIPKIMDFIIERGSDFYDEVF